MYRATMSDPTGTPSSEPPKPDRASGSIRPSGAMRPSAALRAQGREAKGRRTIGWRNRDIVRTAALGLAVYYGAQLFWVANRLFFVVFLGMLFGIAVSGGVGK